MNGIKINLNTNSNEIKLVPLADVHLGDPLCREDVFKKVIDYIKNTNDCYTIINGDIINNALKTSVSDIYTEKYSIDTQIEKAIEYLTPIKDKILLYHMGNHEIRTVHATGFDPNKYICEKLNCEYSLDSYVLELKFGTDKNANRKNKYIIYGTHGNGTGGRRMGSTVNCLEDMTKIVCNADLYLHSHTHVPISYSDEIITTNRKNNVIETLTRTFFNTTSFLSYGGYAEQFGYKKVLIEPRVITITMKRTDNVVRPITDISKISI